VDIKLNGVRRQSLDATEKNWQPRAKGQGQIPGVLFCSPYIFTATHGRGRGKMDEHYIYFEHNARWYYVSTGRSWPSNITVEHV
jgi:hypothetical protein